MKSTVLIKTHTILHEIYLNEFSYAFLFQNNKIK